MNKLIPLIIAAVFLLLPPQEKLAAEPIFPFSSADAQSLGRGGTTIATPPGKCSALGNPATLTPDGFFALGAEYLRARGASEGSWVISVVDTSASVRGALNFYANPEFAGFEKNLWGVAFAQTLTPYLTIGESYHMGEYDPGTGKREDLAAADIGILLDIGARVSLGYVIRNVYNNDSDLLERNNGFGAAMELPWTILLAVDYEEVPFSEGENDLRVGIQFSPIKQLVGRLGFQDIVDRTTFSGGTSYYTAGITYSDFNGTIDAAALFNRDTEKADRIIIGFTIVM
jgi:hypothetical protein